MYNKTLELQLRWHLQKSDSIFQALDNALQFHESTLLLSVLREELIK